MDGADATIELLRTVQLEVCGLRSDTNARLGALEAAVVKLETNMTEGFTELRADIADLRSTVATTHEALGLILHRLLSAEAAVGGATGARTRLDDRMDRLDARVDAREADSESTDP